MDAFLAGKTFGNYRVGEVLSGKSASGTFGAVYVAEPTGGGDKVALRVFPVDLSRDKSLAARLIADMQKACAVEHPNLVKVRDIGTADYKGKRYLYLAAEKLPGESLKSRLAKSAGKPLALHEALRIASQVGAALAAIHRTGGVHRQVSPGAVLLVPDGSEGAGEGAERVCLLDNGVALTASADAQGASPQKGGKNGRREDDIRGLAHLVQTMLGGVGDGAAASEAVLPLRLRNPKVPVRVDAVLRSVLGDTLGPADKNSKLDSVPAFLAALLGTGDAQPSIGVFSEDGRTPPRARASTGPSGLLWAAALAIVAGIGYLLYSQEPATPVMPDLAAPAPTPVVTPLPRPGDSAPAAAAPRDGGVRTYGPGSWPTRTGKIPPLREADEAPSTSSPAPAATGAVTPTATRAPAVAPAGGATAGTLSAPAAPKPQPAAKPPAPPQGPGVPPAGPGSSGQQEVK
jgi:serine/threonine-protein kinase